MVLKDGEVMSKSKGNTVDPDLIIQRYGADSMRLFILFAAPPETELEWDDRGIEGASRFINRVWRIQDNLKPAAESEMLKAMHRAVKKVTEDMESFKFNTAIASMMEFVNAIYQYGADRKVYSTFIQLLSPIAPHMCEELWQILGNPGALARAAWPVFDPSMLVEDRVTYAVQINGKVRSRLEIAAAAGEKELRAAVLSDEKLKPWVEGKEIKKFIVVPGKLVNIVAA